MTNFLEMPRPQNAEQLKNLFNRFGNFLSPENRQMVQAVILEVEKGDGEMDMKMLRAAAAQISTQVQGAGINPQSPQDLQQLQETAAFYEDEGQKNYPHEYSDKDYDYADYNNTDYDNDTLDDNFFCIGDHDDYFSNNLP